MSTEDKVAENPGSVNVSDENPICEACQVVISVRSQIHITVCGHVFHKSCLSKIIKVRHFCPVCDARIVNAQPFIHSRQIYLFINVPSGNTGNTPGQNTSQLATNNTSESLQEMVTALISAQQAQLLTSLNSQITRLVETNVRSSLS